MFVTLISLSTVYSIVVWVLILWGAASGASKSLSLLLFVMWYFGNFPIHLHAVLMPSLWQLHDWNYVHSIEIYEGSKETQKKKCSFFPALVSLLISANTLLFTIHIYGGCSCSADMHIFIDPLCLRVGWSHDLNCWLASAANQMARQSMVPSQWHISSMCLTLMPADLMFKGIVHL